MLIFLGVDYRSVSTFFFDCSWQIYWIWNFVSSQFWEQIPWRFQLELQGQSKLKWGIPKSHYKSNANSRKKQINFCQEFQDFIRLVRILVKINQPEYFNYQSFWFLIALIPIQWELIGLFGDFIFIMTLRLKIWDASGKETSVDGSISFHDLCSSSPVQSLYWTWKDPVESINYPES